MNPDTSAAFQGNASGFLPLIANPLYREEIAEKAGNGIALHMGEFQGAFALCTVGGGEFLDASFGRFLGGTVTAKEPVTIRLLYRPNRTTTSLWAAVTSSRSDGSLLGQQADVQMTRIGASASYYGTLIAVPEGFTDSVQAGQIVTLPLDSGFLTAAESNTPMVTARSTLTTTSTPFALSTALGLYDATVTAVGFTGDHKFSVYPDGPDVDPNDDSPIWDAAAGLNYPVAYSINTSPVAFGVITLPKVTIPAGFTADVKVASAGVDVGQVLGATILGHQIKFGPLSMPGRMSTVVLRESLALTWSIRLRRGLNAELKWTTLNDTGPHTFYWTLQRPQTPTFLDEMGVPLPKTFDLALEKATVAAMGTSSMTPTSDAAEIA